VTTSTPPAPRSGTPSIRWWHKWIGITIGLVLFLWVASGLAMLVPLSPTVWGADLVEPTLDLAGVTITPSQAAAIAVPPRSDSAPPAAIRSVVLRPLLGTGVYLVSPTDAPPVMVHAGTGEVITIAPESARRIASAAMSGRAPLAVERIVVAPIGYEGRLPAYRMTFDDPATTVASSPRRRELARTELRDRRKMLVGHYACLRPAQAASGRRQHPHHGARRDRDCGTPLDLLGVLAVVAGAVPASSARVGGTKLPHPA
jgi:hypothetical protein